MGINMQLENVVREHILTIYRANGYNKVKTAKLLEIGIRTLQRKIQRYEKEGHFIDPIRTLIEARRGTNKHNAAL
jgi:DNA-binding NtrC family response regulator